MQHVLSTGGGQALIDPADTLMLLLDHQTGLFQVVKDIDVAQLRANVTALAKLATLLKLPVITTASVPDGPNGPPMAELKEAAPDAHYVPPSHGWARWCSPALQLRPLWSGIAFGSAAGRSSATN
jgi:nicotinamidase-related amidase